MKEYYNDSHLLMQFTHVVNCPEPCIIRELFTIEISSFQQK